MVGSRYAYYMGNAADMKYLVLYSMENKQATADIGKMFWSSRIMPNSSDSDVASISSASCLVTASYATQVQVALVLSWLCAAVRSSDHAGPSKSSVFVDGEQTDGRRSVSIKLAPLEPVLSDEACWHGLFPHGVIAKNFPIPLRHFGRGLEIPFADMTLLCGCLGFVEYKNGLLVDGLNSILIPRKRLPEDDAFQWHFESKIREEGRIAYTSDVLDILDMQPWHNGTRPAVPDDLLNKRCFLAWAERVTIMVGTENHFNSTTIGDSHANPSASLKYVLSYGLNLGGGVSHLTFGGAITLTPTSIPAFIKPSINNGIHDILTIESTRNYNQFVLVYDTGDRIGWYLPQACVVLHMAHHYLSEQKLDLIDAENQETLLEFANADGDTDVGPAAASILVKNLRCRTRRRLMTNPGPPNQASNRTASYPRTSTTVTHESDDFKTTVERLWYLLDTVGSSSKLNRSEYLKCSERIPNGIHGVDFKELLAPKGPQTPISIRYVEVGQPWSYMTNDRSTVIFCKNFGQAIVPTTDGLCDAWSKVPPKKDFLAMTGHAIHYFLKRQKSGLTKELKWLLKKPLIQSHHQAEHSTVVHTQLLKGKVGAILSKMKDKIGGANTEWIISNIELIDEIKPHSCFLFSAQQGKECANHATDARYEDLLTPADPTEAPLFLTPPISFRTKFQDPQGQPNEVSPIARCTTMMFSAARNQPATSSSSESSRNGNLLVVNQDTGHQASQECIDDSSYNLDAGRRSGKDALTDRAQEQLFSKPTMPLNLQPPRTTLPLPFDTPGDGDQQILDLKMQRALMQEHGNHDHQSPNTISDSGHRGGVVPSSDS